MKVTEQIDAMRALGTDPIQKLVTPRMIATAAMLPALTVIADLIGMFGGFIIGYFIYALQPREYWSTTWRALGWHDVAEGLVKPFVFSFVISLMGCYYGLRTTGGTQGVGRSTTQAVVTSCVLIFVLDLLYHQVLCLPESAIMALVTEWATETESKVRVSRSCGSNTSPFVSTRRPRSTMSPLSYAAAKRASFWARRAAARVSC